MNFPGVDIIDLNDPLLQKRGDRSLDLIRNPQDTPIDHPLYFWLLWTAKEAAYKSVRGTAPFSPKNMVIQLHHTENDLSFDWNNTSGKFEIKDDYVFAYINCVEYLIIEARPKNWSTEIRNHIEQQLGQTVGADTKGLPVLASTAQPISLTHHGRFGAFGL